MRNLALKKNRVIKWKLIFTRVRYTEYVFVNLTRENSAVLQGDPPVGGGVCSSSLLRKLTSVLSFKMDISRNPIELLSSPQPWGAIAPLF